MTWSPIITNITQIQIGSFFGGGYFAGYVAENQDSVPTYALIVAPAESGQPLMNFVAQSGQVNLPSNLSPIDGKLNTDLLINDYPLGPAFPAVYCKDLVYNGCDDWYLPSGYELEIIYHNLAPTDPEIYRQYWYDLKANPPFSDPDLAESKFNSKYNNFGLNPFSVPSRANVPYTYTVPGQTSVAAFQQGGPQAFLFDPVVGTELGYWSSGVFIGGIPTFSETYGICFADGSVVSSDVNTSQSVPVYYVRPVRRIPVGAGAWDPVADGQTPGWTPINTSQTPNWTPIT